MMTTCSTGLFGFISIEPLHERLVGDNAYHRRSPDLPDSCSRHRCPNTAGVLPDAVTRLCGFAGRAPATCDLESRGTRGEPQQPGSVATHHVAEAVHPKGEAADPDSRD